jgi:hypothetical protein
MVRLIPRSIRYTRWQDTSIGKQTRDVSHREYQTMVRRGVFALQSRRVPGYLRCVCRSTHRTEYRVPI